MRETVPVPANDNPGVRAGYTRPPMPWATYGAGV